MVSVPTSDPLSLEQQMAAIAAGDGAALFALLEANRGAIAGLVVRTLRDLHRDDLARNRDVVDGLVVEAGFVLFDRAAGWRPGGASPWSWAQRAIRARIVAEIGHPSVDGDALDGVTAPSLVVEREVCFDELCIRYPSLQVLSDALAEITTARNRAVFLAYRRQLADGDPSPAVTVGAEFGLSAANVRQIDRRTRVALAKAAEQPGREPLRHLAWSAA
jgi:hypothetical protein